MKVSSRTRVPGFGAAIVLLAGCIGATDPNIDGCQHVPFLDVRFLTLDLDPLGPSTLPTRDDLALVP